MIVVLVFVDMQHDAQDMSMTHSLFPLFNSGAASASKRARGQYEKD